MSKSKNDIPVAGGYLRQTFHPVRTQYDAIYTIIDPQTGKPYTYGRLSEDLAQRKQDYPQLAALIDPVLSQITKKAELRPNSVCSDGAPQKRVQPENCREPAFLNSVR